MADLIHMELNVGDHVSLLVRKQLLLVKTNTKIYLKYIYFALSILQIHVHIYVLNKNTLQLYLWYLMS